MRYVRYVEDDRGDLVEVEVYCSAQCWRDAGLGDPFGHYIPSPEPADYAQHCPQCGTMTVAPIDEPAFDGWPALPESARLFVASRIADACALRVRLEGAQTATRLEGAAG